MVLFGNKRLLWETPWLGRSIHEFVALFSERQNRACEEMIEDIMYPARLCPHMYN